MHIVITHAYRHAIHVWFVERTIPFFRKNWAAFGTADIAPDWYALKCEDAA